MKKLVINYDYRGSIKTKYYEDENGKKQGKYMSWWFNNKIKRIIHYKNGILHGDYMKFYDDGTIKYDCNYVDGKLHGRNEYWEDGILKQVNNFVRGDNYGISIEYE